MTLPDFLLPMAMQDTPGGRRGTELPGLHFQACHDFDEFGDSTGRVIKLNYSVEQ